MFFVRLRAHWIVMLAAFSAGCGHQPSESPSESLDTQAASYRPASPNEYLASVFTRYRNAGSYHDRGVIRLRYQVGDREESKLAPAHVWLDHDRLSIEAYDVRLWSDSDSLTAWIKDADTDDFDSQVLKMPAIRGRPSVQSLLSDEILVEKISAGLAGPPPQLDWLFSPEPMKRLFHGQHRFEFGQSHSIDGRLCRSVLVTAGEQRYTFWIDEGRGVIRRVELPSIVAAPGEGEPVQRMSLSFDLIDASFDRPQSQPRLDMLPSAPKYVRRFVPLPPLEPSHVLGSIPGSIPFPNRSRELGLVVRFAGDSISARSAQTVEGWNAAMPESLRRRIEVLMLVDESVRVPSQTRLSTLQDSKQSAARSLALSPGSLAIVDARGRVVWTQPPLTDSEGLVRLGAVVGDLLAGVDVPGRIREQWKEQVAAYQRVLKQESVSHK